MTASAADTRQLEVIARLDRVTDPELDEPVTGLGFVTAVEVDAARVHIRFRLPTYWCAANFAFLMADDMRREVAALPWVESVGVELGEHMYAETLNHGMQEGRSFDDTFGAEASSGGLDAIRRTFARKSFQRRQEHVLQHLLAAGHTAEALVPLTVRQLRALEADAATGAAIARYLDRREVPGGFDDEDLAFVDVDGRAIRAAALGTYLRGLRNVAVNMEFNGALCRGLLAARFNEEQPAEDGPGLRHFVRQAAAAR
ncbi:MAG: iron-sulfur cluster assembly protein [Pseudomonadota bacterium]|nr:iron-sulfur cluster assembly protein [Pseudomonadota bacterium]